MQSRPIESKYVSEINESKYVGNLILVANCTLPRSRKWEINLL